MEHDILMNRRVPLCAKHTLIVCNVEYDTTQNILLSQRPSNKTMGHLKNSLKEFHPSRKMSHMTSTCYTRRPLNHTSSRNASSTSAILHDTSKNFEVHVISMRVHASPHVSMGPTPKTHDVTLPGKNMLTWRPCALRGHHGTPCFM